MNQWLFISGCTIVGFIIPEFIAMSGVRVPLGLNLLGAAALALISASFVL
jgi:hypothetical protein